MNNELLIMRHGESDWEHGEEDFARTLTESGRRDVLRMGEWLLAQRLLPERIVSSPAQRALSTAAAVCEGMDQAGRSIAHDERIYEAGVAQLLAVLADCPADCGRLLLVGHNPGLERLLVRLAGADAAQAQGGGGMSPGALARLELPGTWQQAADAAGATGGATLLSITRPQRG